MMAKNLINTDIRKLFQLDLKMIIIRISAGVEKSIRLYRISLFKKDFIN